MAKKRILDPFVEKARIKDLRSDITSNLITTGDEAGPVTPAEKALIGRTEVRSTEQAIRNVRKLNRSKGVDTSKFTQSGKKKKK